MHSIRTKTTLLTVIAIIIAIVITTILAAVSIQKLGHSDSNQMLLLLCETGQKNLDSYFGSVEQSVETVSSFVEEDLKGLDQNDLEEHIDRARAIFEKAAYKTNGVLTYYYRIDPPVSDTVKGFWYTNLDGEGFTEHEVTDITLYDTEDTSSLVWFTVPKATGEAIWLPPYITDNLDVRVISYNEPIYWNGRFIGVIGMEIDYSTMAEQVDNIRLYENGYAFIDDADRTLVYHPRMDVAEMTEETRPKIPEELANSEETFIRYTFDGVEKQLVWLPLGNGMRLNVTVPVSEINGSWQYLIYEILLVSLVVLIIFIVVTMRFAGRITKPLRELTEVAEQVDQGNYDIKLENNGSDEVGILARTFNSLVGHLRVYIGELNSLAYADALTSVHNKGAYDIYMRKFEAERGETAEGIEFAICVFDCDDLKKVNDQYGHDKGDIYLKNACNLICNVFSHSPVFRTGGDEFIVVLRGEDFEYRTEKIRQFREESEKSCARTDVMWEQIRVSLGVAVYDPKEDRSAGDAARRADKLMYEDKRRRRES